jgi:hypothetical protein
VSGTVGATARARQSVGTAIRAGTIMDMAAEGGQVMEAVEQAEALPDGNRAARNAIPRIVIQWLKPCAWLVTITPMYRFWGRDE